MDREEFVKTKYIEDFYNYVLLKNYSLLTLNSYMNDLYYFYEFLGKDITFASEEDIRSYITYLSKNKKKSSTINRSLSTFKTFYKYLMHNNIISKKDYPLYKVQYLKREKMLPKFLYYNELLQILDESNNDKESLRDRLIIEMLYATGVRVSELVNIKISDIDFDNKRINVLGKGNKERIVYYGEYAEEIMEKYLDTHKRKDNNYLFLNANGEELTDSGVRYIMNNIMNKLSIKTHVTPHVLRHTFATDMLNNGCDIKIVQELLGHSSLKSTQIYTHVTNDRLKKVYYECFKRRE